MQNILKDSASLKRSNIEQIVSIDEMNVADELIPTRASLLDRLKNLGDNESWRVFFDTYWRLIYRAGLRAGLNDAEAQDAVQDTMVSVAKNMQDFHYDETGSFKAWLLRLTSWRVMDQIRKRDGRMKRVVKKGATRTGTETVEKVPDPRIPLEQSWDEEWEHNILHAALERVKKKVDNKQYQIFALRFIKEWSVARISKALKINPAKVYLANHRVTKLVKKEVTALKKKPV